MTDQKNINQSTSSSFNMLKAMVGIGLICALLIALTYESTLPIITKNKAEAFEKAIFKVLPDITSKTAFYLDENGDFLRLPEGETADNVVYAGYDDDKKLVGLAIEGSGQGYADILKILYGYDPVTQTIVGFYVLESKETPGLGDKIEKDENFLTNFKALDAAVNADGSAMKNTIVPVKNGKKQNAWEVDGITGATISSRAIGNIIGSGSEFWIPKIYKSKDKFEFDGQ
jgi:electron transport complex protein RnfG